MKHPDFSQMTNKQLTDFAIEHLGEEHTEVRQAALMEHHRRLQNDPNCIVEKPGESIVLNQIIKNLQL